MKTLDEIIKDNIPETEQYTFFTTYQLIKINQMLIEASDQAYNVGFKDGSSEENNMLGGRYDILAVKTFDDYLKEII